MPGSKRKDIHKKEQELPQWFHECRKQKVIEYDTTKYPFRPLLADWLEVPAESLEEIHLLPLTLRQRVHPRICQAWRAANMPKLSREARKRDTSTQKQFFQSASYERFMNCYRRFLKEVIAPECTSSSSSSNVVYQAPPTTRVVLPNGKSTISKHSDQDYSGHQPAEINFWLPLTTVSGTNSLWLESEPQKGDFQDVRLKYGQLLKFNGYQCQHYTLPNTDATAVCRVSFDFRVIPSELCIQRKQCGEFCVEETTDNGCYVAYPHKFWNITRNVDTTTIVGRPNGTNNEEEETMMMEPIECSLMLHHNSDNDKE